MNNQELVTQGKNLPVHAHVPQQETVLASDVVIPKLLLMQQMSELVQEKKAQSGEMVRSIGGTKLGDEKKPVDIIPLTFQNLWMLQEDAMGKGKYEFRGYEPRTAANENAEWDFMVNGTKWKRTKVMNLFALLPADIDAQMEEMKKFEETGEIDLDRTLLPVVIPFRNTSFKAGREIATLFVKADSVARRVGKPVPVYGQMIRLGCYLEKNDKGSFYVYKTEPAGKTSPEHKEVAATWYATLMSRSFAVDESDAKEDSAAPVDAGGFRPV